MAKVEQLVQQLNEALRQRQWRISTAESCTGGKIAAAITSLAGSSDVFEMGWVTYSNAAKEQQLHVPAVLLVQYGAVSEEVARAMALGAATGAGAEVAIAVTGIAGPGGGSVEKPVGTVWLAWYCHGKTYAEMQVFPGNRKEIREATVVRSLEKAIALLR